MRTGCTPSPAPAASTARSASAIAEMISGGRGTLEAVAIAAAPARALPRSG